MMGVVKNRGFSLVEISVALVIVGVLIGGILQAQKLIWNARVLSTVSEIKIFEAAMRKCQDVYGGLPGDLVDADQKIRDCGSVCASRATDSATNTTWGDGIIGTAAWCSSFFLAQASHVVSPSIVPQFETLLFWYEMNKAGLITAVNGDAAVAGKRVMFGKALPAAEVGGGFFVGYMANTCAFTSNIGRPTTSGGPDYTIPGTVLAMVDIPDGQLNGASRQQAMTPNVAAQIDRKMDDGLPDTGEVQAFGSTSSCYGGPTAPYNYNESINSKDCGLFIRIGQ